MQIDFPDATRSISVVAVRRRRLDESRATAQQQILDYLREENVGLVPEKGMGQR
jgi:hypothetical protein